MTSVLRPSFPALVLATTVVLLVAASVGAETGAEQFEDKGWELRLVAYPALMLVAPGIWWAAHQGRSHAPPYGAFGLLMLPFLSDTAANWLDLFRTVSWWDDASHAVHWCLLASGIGLLVSGRVRPRWVVVPLATGCGALLAIAWELAEWWLFMRHGVEARGAHRDTLGDLALGVAGALVGALVVAGHDRRRWRGTYPPEV